MIRDETGKHVIQTKGRKAMPDTPPKTTWQTPENIKPSQVKLRLCKDGPKKCAECGSCAFGRWYLEHMDDGKEKKCKATEGA